MTPAELDRYTAETRELLKGTSHKKLEVTADSLNPYVPDTVAGPPQTGPFTFAWAFIWTKPALEQKPAWEALIGGFKIALAQIYPDCQVAHASYNVDDPKFVVLALAQFYAKMRRTVRGNLIFIEADVVCNRRCDPFEADFDIGLTDCKDQWPMMPFNPGVMFVKDTPGAQKFLDTAMEYACALPQNFPLWYAYQIGLSHAYLVLKDEVNIKIFPYAEYNWPPEVYAPTDAYFIHLKGNRKRMQREFVVPLLEGKRGQIIIP